MRAFIPLLALLLSLDAAAAPPAVRLAVVHQGELLPSESKALAAAQKKLGKLATLTVADATAAEVALASTPGGAVPDEWQGVATVIVLQVLPPRGDRDRRVSRGAGSVVVFRPPSASPVYAERVEGEAAMSLQGDNLEASLRGLIGLAARAGGSR